MTGEAKIDRTASIAPTVRGFASAPAPNTINRTRAAGATGYLPQRSRSTPMDTSQRPPLRTTSTAVYLSASKDSATKVTTVRVRNGTSADVTFQLATNDALFLGPYNLASGRDGTYTFRSALTYSVGLMNVTLSDGREPTFPNGKMVSVASPPPPPPSAPPPIIPVVPFTLQGTATTATSTAPRSARTTPVPTFQKPVVRVSSKYDFVAEYLELKAHGPAPGSESAHRRTLRAWLTRKRGRGGADVAGLLAKRPTADERAFMSADVRGATQSMHAEIAQMHTADERHEALRTFGTNKDNPALDAYMAARRAGQSHTEAMRAGQAARLSPERQAIRAQAAVNREAIAKAPNAVPKATISDAQRQQAERLGPQGMASYIRARNQGYRHSIALRVAEAYAELHGG